MCLIRVVPNGMIKDIHSFFSRECKIMFETFSDTEFWSVFSIYLCQYGKFEC